MSNRTLNDLLNEITAVAKTASKDPELIPLAARSGHEMAISQAKDRLETLKDDYKTSLLDHATVYYVSGDPDRVSEFLSEAMDLGSHVFLAAPARVYEDLATSVEETMGGSREFSGNQLAALIYAQKEWARIEGLPRPTMPELTELRACPDFEATVAYVRELVRRSSGDQTAYAYVRNRVGSSGLARECRDSEIIIILNEVSPEEQAGFDTYFTRTKILQPLEADTVVDKSFVIKVLEQKEAIKKPLRNKKNNNQEQ